MADSLVARVRRQYELDVQLGTIDRAAWDVIRIDMHKMVEEEFIHLNQAQRAQWHVTTDRWYEWLVDAADDAKHAAYMSALFLVERPHGSA